MSSKVIIFLISITSLLFSGCVSSLSLAYRSDPAGASLYDDGRFIGKTPCTLNYNLSQESINRGEVRCREVTARWPSGAESTCSVNCDLKRYGYSQTFTFIRPNVPGVEVDVQYAIIQEQQKRADERASNQAQCDALSSIYYNNAAMEAQKGNMNAANGWKMLGDLYK